MPQAPAVPAAFNIDQAGRNDSEGFASNGRVCRYPLALVFDGMSAHVQHDIKRLVSAVSWTLFQCRSSVAKGFGRAFTGGTFFCYACFFKVPVNGSGQCACYTKSVSNVDDFLECFAMTKGTWLQQCHSICSGGSSSSLH